MQADIREVRRFLAFFFLGAGLFVAPGLFGAVATGPVVLVGGLFCIAMLLAPTAGNGAGPPAVVWGIVAVFVATLLVSLTQIWLTVPSATTNDALAAEVGARLAPAYLPRTINPGQGVQMLGPLLVNLLVFVLAARLASTPERARRIIQIAAGVVFFWMALSLVLFILDSSILLWTPKRAYRDSLTGPFVNRNTAATFFGTGLLCLIALNWRALAAIVSPLVRAGEARQALGLAMIARVLFPIFLLLLALVLTRSRAGILLSAIVAGSMLIGLCFGRELAALLRASRWRHGMIALAAVLVLGAALVAFVDVASERGTGDGGRLPVYAATLELISRYPLWGVGLGGFPDAFPMVRPPDLSSVGVWDRAHNILLETAAELGVPLAIVMALAALAAVGSLAAGARNRQRYPELPGLGLAVALLGGLHGMVDFSLQIPGYSVLFFALLGTGLAQSKSLSRPAREITPVAVEAGA